MKSISVIINKTGVIVDYLEGEEELNEVKNSLNDGDKLDKEITDLMTVCSCWLIHRGCDISYLLKKNAENNETRKD